MNIEGGEARDEGGQQARNGWRVATVEGTAANIPVDVTTSDEAISPKEGDIIDPLKERAVNDITNLPPSPLDSALKTLHGRVSAISVESTTVEAPPVLPPKVK